MDTSVIWFPLSQNITNMTLFQKVGGYHKGVLGYILVFLVAGGAGESIRQ